MAQRVALGDISQQTLDNLGQLYQYDFSEFTGDRPDGNGRFPFHAYAEPKHERFAIRADDELAGFAIVSFGEAFRDPDEQVWWIDEFFVMRPFRNAGVGEAAARALFDARPGTWEVGQLAANLPAQAFWRKVIGRYTQDDFTEVVFDDERWKGPVQYFVSA